MCPLLQRLVNSEMQSIGWLVGGQQDSSASHKTGAAAQQQQQQLQQQVRDALHGSKQPVQQQAQPGPAVVPVAAVAAVALPAAPAVTVGTGRGNVVDNSLGGSMKPMGAGRGVRSRKLEMDVDFEKEAALLAAKQRAAAQGRAMHAVPLAYLRTGFRMHMKSSRICIRQIVEASSCSVFDTG